MANSRRFTLFGLHYRVCTVIQLFHMYMERGISPENTEFRRNCSYLIFLSRETKSQPFKDEQIIEKHFINIDVVVIVVVNCESDPSIYFQLWAARSATDLTALYFIYR